MRFEETLDKMLAKVGLVKAKTSKGNIALFKAHDVGHTDPIGAIEIYLQDKPNASGRNWDTARVESWSSTSSLFYSLCNHIMWFDGDLANAKTYFDGKVMNPWIGKHLSEIAVTIDFES